MECVPYCRFGKDIKMWDVNYANILSRGFNQYSKLFSQMIRRNKEFQVIDKSSTRNWFDFAAEKQREIKIEKFSVQLSVANR